MLLTAYSDDARVPLSGVLKYAEKLKKAIYTHFTVKPKSGTCTRTLSHILSKQSLDLLHVDPHVYSQAYYSEGMLFSQYDN